jgi:hypothetical protein
LEKLPDEGDGLIRCLWSVTDRPKVQDEEWADSELCGFTIADLVATQDYLKRDTVKYHLEVLSKIVGGENVNPNVVLHNGKYKIYDGHHRLMALMLVGAKQANCWLLERE